MGKVVIWHNNTCKVLNQENEFKLYDIIELVNAAQSKYQYHDCLFVFVLH